MNDNTFTKVPSSVLEYDIGGGAGGIVDDELMGSSNEVWD